MIYVIEIMIQMALGLQFYKIGINNIMIKKKFIMYCLLSLLFTLS